MIIGLSTTNFWISTIAYYRTPGRGGSAHFPRIRSIRCKRFQNIRESHAKFS